MADFKARLDLAGRGIAKTVERVMRKAALVIDREVVRRTPVDTGRARSNWIVTFFEPADYSRVNIDHDGAAGLAESAAAVAAYKVDLGPIYITNNVVYIGKLENGWSRQAPAGMAKQAVLAGAEVVKSS